MARTALAVVVGVVAAWPAPVQAQTKIEEYLGRPVVSVKLQIEGREETSDQLRALIDVRPGQPLTLEDLRSTTAHFLNLSRFEDVRVLGAEVPGGVEITFRLVPVHPIDRVQFSGEPGLAPAELERLLKQRYGGLLPARERTTDIEDVVRDILADEGFRSAAVTAETVPSHEPERATLLIVVQAGPRATIRQTTVTGTSPMSETEIIRRAGASPGLPYRQRAIQTALARIRDDLRGQSYYAAVASHTPRFDGNDVDVTLYVEAGPRVRVVVLPPGAVSPDEVALLIRQEGSVDEDLLDDTDAAIETRLRREGYWKADVSHRTEDVEGVRVITFTVERGLRYRISSIDWSVGVKLPRTVIDKLLDARPGQWFDQNRVEAGLRRIQDEYWRLGYYLAEFKPAYEEIPGTAPGEAGVVIHPNPTEGPLGFITAVRFVFATGPRVPEADVRNVMQSRVGQPFVVATMRADFDALETLYANRGFLSATMEITPEFAADGRDVTLVVSITEGPQILVGEITVIGNEDIRTDVILQEITLRSGMPLSPAALEQSANQLRLMGVFSRVRIQEEQRLPGETVANLVILVEESPDTTLGGGGGLEVQSLSRQTPEGAFEDYLDFSPRAFFEIGRRNLGGRNRSINFFSRVSFNTRDDNVDDPRGLGFGEYRVTGTLRERHAFRSDTDLLFGVTAEQARRQTFNFIRQTMNAEALRRLSPSVSVAGRYSLEFTELLNEKIPESLRPLIDRRFPQVRLSILSSGVQWDRRDNPIAPTGGTWLGADAEFALRGIGSEVGYMKTFLQASGFRPLTADRRYIGAVRAQLGLARGFERQVQRLDEDGQPVIGPDGQPVLDTVADLPASQRFYAGGSTTVRGYQLDRLGVPEILTPDGLSTGGNGLVVLNAELRTRVWRDNSSRVPFVDDLGVVGFLDAGNVFKNASDISLPDLRAAAGFGIRLGSALGPIRLDFGFKLRPRIIGTSGQREKGWEYHLSIGEAF
ncbi:MAG TPA: POTRA domain-containing protein [Vicinamibacterales bacterium]|nr:POTRA domain-containing protein [Vicinamibacterales bacterium]